MNVFVLYFMGPHANGGRYTFGKFFGAYSSQSRAARAVERLQGLPEYRHYPRGFLVECIELDKDYPNGLEPPPPRDPPDQPSTPE
jgi:hypothetical protein